MSRASRRFFIAAGLTGLGAGIYGWQRWRSEPDEASFVPRITSYEELSGCHYRAVEQAPLDAPSVQVISIPEFPGSTAIWGATGRDQRGHIWFGVSAAPGTPQPSAHLFQYDPAFDRVQDRGDVVGELRRLSLLRRDAGQMKIHSRIVQAEDGHLYFTSMDEQGENTDGSRLPTWGSHLWRLRLPENRWEHVRAFPEGLVALAGSGRYLYALGYFNHVVHQYDCRTGNFRTATVGSVGGHISRNLMCDHRGHVFVPRLREAGSGLVSSLVELDPELRECHATPLANYTHTRDDHSHGITAFQPLADRSIVFSTDQGYLYRIDPELGEPTFVHDLGFLHPRGRAYVASLFTSDGQTHLMGLGRRTGSQAEWLVYDLRSHAKRAVALNVPRQHAAALQDASLYGSVTRDNTGACYLGGTYAQQGRSSPLLVKVS